MILGIFTRIRFPYTHFFRAKSGFQEEVDKMLVKDAKLSELQRHVVLLLDEMKVKESLV